MPESPAEKQALENLDEATREVGWDEFTKEAERERRSWWTFGPLRFFRGYQRVPFRHVPGDSVAEPVDDPDPASPGGLRDALHEHDD